MAYISQETKKELAPAIKAVAKKYGVKVTIGVNHHSSLVVLIKEGVLDFIGAANAHNKVVAQRRGYGDQEFSVSDNFSINPYHDERHWTDVGFETEAKFVLGDLCQYIVSSSINSRCLNPAVDLDYQYGG